MDIAFASSGNDHLWGDAGGDWLFGGHGAGVDILVSTGPGDLLSGGSGTDYVYASGGHVAAYGGTGDDIFVIDGAGNAVWGDEGNDYFAMGSGDDAIHGGGGVEVMQGGGGADLHDDGPGVDYLFPGAGTDRIVMTPLSATDVVYGFDPAMDVLDLRGFRLTDPSQIAFSDYGSFTVVTLAPDVSIWMIRLTPAQITSASIILSLRSSQTAKRLFPDLAIMSSASSPTASVASSTKSKPSPVTTQGTLCSPSRTICPGAPETTGKAAKLARQIRIAAPSSSEKAPG